MVYIPQDFRWKVWFLKDCLLTCQVTCSLISAPGHRVIFVQTTHESGRKLEVCEIDGDQGDIAALCSGGPQDSQTVETAANQVSSKDEEIQKSKCLTAY